MYKLNGRRQFITAGLKLAAIGGIAGLGLFSSCKEDEEGQEVSPPEDLMQEHGLLNRILLIYDTCKQRLLDKQEFDKAALSDAAGIMRSFVEDYHEKQEENYLFPRFKKANVLTSLVDTLLVQHNAGRRITSEIRQLSGLQTATDNETQRLASLLNSFNRMYRPHEAREDTVLFPAFRKIVSKHEYDSLGEEFEKNEHKLFGEDGFDNMVNKVEKIERTLGIYELQQFTPAT